MRETLGGSNSLGETKLDALRFYELEKSFAVSAHVAVDFSQGWKLFAFGLSNVEHIHTPETVQSALSLLRIGILFRTLLFIAPVADHWRENENSLFATPDEAAKRVPSAESCNGCRI